jgi:hypothetical protein
MTNAIETPTNELPPPVPQAPLPPLPPGPPPRRRSAGHIVAIIAGALLLIPSISIFFGGGAVMLASAVADDDGYFDVTLDRLESDGVAIATVDLWQETGDDDDWPWVLDWLDLDVRVRADGAADSDEIFVGIARSVDVSAYLDDAEYSEIVEIDNRSARYVERPGTLTIAAPDTQDFWTESVSGEDELELNWEAQGGKWSVVLMNADGSPDVAADVQVGVQSDVVMPIGITMLVLGGLLTIGAVVLIVVGARGSRN